MTNPETKQWFLVLAIGATNEGGISFQKIEATDAAKAAQQAQFYPGEYDYLQVYELGQSDGDPVLEAESMNMPTWMLKPGGERL